jgi:hypothetical protein
MRRATTLMLLVVLAGCSTKPRDFRPNLAVAPVNQDVQTRDFAVCKMMVDRGVRGNFAKQAAALTPGVVGTTAGATISFVAAFNSFASLGTASTAGAATLSTALPIVGGAASVAIAAGLKRGNEKKVKSALGVCMKEYGHDVTDWKVDRSKPSALPAVLPLDSPKLGE